MANAIMINGGSGGGMELIKSYTLTESWENDTKGNSIAIFNTVLSDVSKQIGDCFICVIKNNTARLNYRANAMVFANITGDGFPFGFAIRNNWQAIRRVTSDISMWVSNGATIDVYKVDMRTL